MVLSLAIMCKVARDTLGMSQKEIAEQIGSNQTEVSFIERGFIPSNSYKIEAIEQLYDEAMKLMYGEGGNYEA